MLLLVILRGCLDPEALTKSAPMICGGSEELTSEPRLLEGCSNHQDMPRPQIRLLSLAAPKAKVKKEKCCSRCSSELSVTLEQSMAGVTPLSHGEPAVL